MRFPIKVQADILRPHELAALLHDTVFKLLEILSLSKLQLYRLPTEIVDSPVDNYRAF